MIEDPVTFEVIKNALISVAREMSQALRRTAFSPNIKERRDCSSAVFDSKGQLIAQSKDIPVHLGAMPLSVKSCINTLGLELREGTMALVNDPYSGGSHLPDLTLVSPIFRDGKLRGFTANRAHHADIGGISPGSMPGLSLSIDEEGVIIEPRIVVKKGILDTSAIVDLLDSTRTPKERLGDLSAQIAANNVGRRNLLEIGEAHSWQTIETSFQNLIMYSEKRMMNAVSPLVGEKASFEDIMDSDGAGEWKIPIRVSLEFTSDGVEVDFSGTSRQVSGNINCPLASSLSAVYYVFIALFGYDIPSNEGCWRAIRVNIPPGSLLNPNPPAAVSAGNVETTQRIVDTTLGALAKIIPEKIPAASQGTMNNLTIGGIHHGTGEQFSFYETIGGGVGAMQNYAGTAGVHSHMTNTLNTPIEALEIEYPLRVIEYSIRKASGGKGKWYGGDGIIREIQILSDDCYASIQSERREKAPWGLKEGMPGKPGRNLLIYDNREFKLEAKTTVKTLKGSIVKIETPGGGGWGWTDD